MLLYSLAFSPEALSEIENIINYYKEINPAVAERFRNELFKIMSMLKKRPHSRGFRYADVRFAVIRKFPYAAHYTVDEDYQMVKIQAVLGFKQDNKKYWKKRF
jgi:plasmid stabilization system protein ParE